MTQQKKYQNSPLPLTNDAVFKLYFCQPENEHLLRDFLLSNTALSPSDLVSIKIENPTLPKLSVNEKDFVVDIRITDAKGKHLHIEMQMKRHKAFIERMVAYNARQYSTQLKRGEDYLQLKASISLIITNFRVFDDTKDISEHILFRRKNGKEFTSAQQFYIIDLTKVPEDTPEFSNLWLALLSARTEEDIKMLMEKSEVMNDAGEQLLKLSQDEINRNIAQAREDSQWAWEFTQAAAKREGIEEGRERAIKLFVETLLELEIPREEIQKKLIEKFEMSLEDATTYMKTCEY